MKILISLFIALLLTSSPCYAAISAGVEWEVRTGGNALNGGCYDLANDGGTDYSQQAAAQMNVADISSDGTTGLVSATGGFTAAMVDNCIQLSSGTNLTAGFYEITAYTDTNNITVDRDVDDGVGALTGDTVGYVGGAIIHPFYIQDAVEGDNKVHIESGTYVKVGAATTIFTVGSQADSSNSNYTLWEGYKDSRGDNPTGDDRPLFDCNDDTADGIYLNAGGQVFKYLRIADCTGRGIYSSVYLGSVTYIGLKITGCDGDNFSLVRQYNAAVMIDCESSGAGDNGVETERQSSRIVGCYIHDNSGGGIWGGGTNQSLSIIGNVIDSNADNGVYIDQNWCPIVMNNIFINNTGAGKDGIYANHKDGSNVSSIYLNNIAMDNGDYGFADVDTIRIGDYNLTNGNGTGAYVSGWLPADYDITGSDATFTAGADDWTAASGSPALSVGFPGDSPRSGLTGDYETNIGVDQDDNAAGGGTAVGSISTSTNF